MEHIPVITVLFVDDEPTLLQLAKTFLQEAGDFRVVTATSAKEALGALQAHSPDIIVSDYQMPGGDGIYLLRKVRENYPDMPFILFTGRGQEEVAIEAIEHGVDYYLQKGAALQPHFDDLSRRIMRAIDRRRAECRIRRLQRLYAVTSAINRVMVRARDSGEILSEACRIVVDEGGFLMAWVGEMDSATRLVRPVTSYGQVGDYLDTTVFPADESPKDPEPTGKAIREGRIVICNDVRDDLQITGGQATLLSRGFYASAAFPFPVRPGQRGVITLYSGTIGIFDDEIVDLLRVLTEDIGYALGTIDQEHRREAAEAKRREAEREIAHLATFPEMNPNPVIEIGGDGTPRYANPAALHVFPSLPDAGLTHPLIQAVLPDIAAILDSRREIVRELHLDTRWFEATINAVASPPGEILPGIRIYIREITLWKNADLSLRQSEARLNAIIQGSAIPQFVIDRDHTVLFWNRALEEVSGIPATQIVGTRDQWKAFYRKERPCLADLLVDEQYDRIEEYYKGKCGPSRHLEGAFEATDHFPKMGHGGTWLYFTAALIRDDDGEIIGAVETLEDVTDQKRAEAALILAQKKIHLLSSITRHDILNQLTALTGYLELQEELCGEEEISALIAKERRIATTIERQIAFTREYESIGMHAPSWQDVAILISRVAGSLDTGRTRVAVGIEGYEIYSDPLLEKVFYNLIDNALTHAGPGLTTISFSVREVKRGITIICEDDGAGVPEDEKEKIFERGYGRKTGLGLFLAKEILSITGISIRETGVPGRGACFELTVPRRGFRRLMTVDQA